MNWKKILSAGLALALAVTVFTGCGEKKDAAKTDAKVLKLGFDDSFPPMGFKNDAGEYTGFDIELAKAVTEDLGMELELIPINWDTKDADLDSGNVDCLWNGFTKTGREGKYAFTDPYMTNRQVIVVKKDSGLKTLADLTGKSLVLQKESTAVNALDAKAAFKDKLAEVREVPENLTAMQEVETGNIDAALLDEVVARYYLRNNPDKGLVVLDESLADEEYVVACKLGNDELAKKLDKGIKDAKESGKYDEIHKKYFNE
ncbi:MAG: amino acid ABC transporter substrate-binding protein [Eubacteriales bacterium]|nr:amino acid ABC transporter substrate-binding protein [Eubacteriales bacterium]